MNTVLLICVMLFELNCLYYWNSVTCKRVRSNRGCLLGNNDRRFGKHIVWRQACRSRRKSDSDSFKLPVLGPKITPEYDPTIGYEPYWATGDWVFETPDAVKGDACGEECALFHKQYGVICAVRRDRWHNLFHRTFENYCEMLNSDCEKKYVWLIAYRGECQPPIKTFPTKANLIVSRAIYYLTEMEERMNPTLPPKIPKGTI